jgi:hypothetical protein
MRRSKEIEERIKGIVIHPLLLLVGGTPLKFGYPLTENRQNLIHDPSSGICITHYVEILVKNPRTAPESCWQFRKTLEYTFEIFAVDVATSTDWMLTRQLFSYEYTLISDLQQSRYTISN